MRLIAWIGLIRRVLYEHQVLVALSAVARGYAGSDWEEDHVGGRSQITINPRLFTRNKDRPTQVCQYRSWQCRANELERCDE